MLKVIPFRWIPRLFSAPHSSVSSQQSTPNTSSLTPHISRLTSHISYLEQLKTATQRASKVSLWRNKCLIQSLAARRMLSSRRIMSELSLGVAKGHDGKMIAHAWIKAGDFEVVEQSGDYKELFCF
jgi:hypothetical protein